MTYNVFGGTLNLAQSINHGSPVSTVYCISVHRIRHLQPSKSSSVAPTVAVSFNRQTNDCPAVHTHCRMLYLLLGCLIVRCRRCVCCRRVRYSIWSRFVLAHSTCIGGRRMPSVRSTNERACDKCERWLFSTRNFVRNSRLSTVPFCAE